MNAPCTPARLGYTGILSGICAVPRIRQRGFFAPVLGELRPALGDEEREIANTRPGFTNAESESPTLNVGGFSLKFVEALMAFNPADDSVTAPPPVKIHLDTPLDLDREKLINSVYAAQPATALRGQR